MPYIVSLWHGRSERSPLYDIYSTTVFCLSLAAALCLSCATTTLPRPLATAVYLSLSTPISFAFVFAASIHAAATRPLVRTAAADRTTNRVHGMHR